MPTTADIREALSRNDADAAEALIEEVNGKRAGRGLSGHDRQVFETQIARIRALQLHAMPAPEPVPAPAPRRRSTRSRAVRLGGEDGIEAVE